jgi:hypothetical protein
MSKQQYIDDSTLEYSEKFIRDNGINDPEKIKQVFNIVLIQDYNLSEAIDIVKNN